MNLNPTNEPQVPEWPPDHWADPDSERHQIRRRLQRARVGFSLLGLALVIASLSTIGYLILVFSGHRQRVGAMLGIPSFDLIEQSLVVWGSLLGVILLCGRGPGQGWAKRAGLLLLMCLVDAVLWGLDNAATLGLQDGEVGHEWFRLSLGTALGWSEFALIAGLAADVAADLGEVQTRAYARAVRSLATTGAMVWFMYFYSRTDWNPPLWPLRERPPNDGTILMYLGWWVLSAILLVQVTGLTLLAGRCCARTLRQMAAEDRANDHIPSRSEAGWDELNRDRDRSSPKGGA